MKPATAPDALIGLLFLCAGYLVLAAFGLVPKPAGATPGLAVLSAIALAEAALLLYGITRFRRLRVRLAEIERRPFAEPVSPVQGTFGPVGANDDPEISPKVRAILKADLRHALSHGEIVPFYQPLVALDDGRLTGFELLARWNHPSLGLISPSAFIPVAEESGVVGELFYHLLEAASADAGRWPAGIGLSVNVSPMQFGDRQLASRILATLAENGIDPSRLELEITESALVGEISSARRILTKLRQAGVVVALDDFGTGYSSLRHLNDLPIDRVKIDRLFIDGAARNRENWKVVRAIVQLAHALDLETTAEGIETVEVAEILRGIGADVGQGYLFGVPQPAAATSNWLRALRKAPPGTLPRLP